MDSIQELTLRLTSNLCDSIAKCKYFNKFIFLSGFHVADRATEEPMHQQNNVRKNSGEREGERTAKE